MYFRNIKQKNLLIWFTLVAHEDITVHNKGGGYLSLVRVCHYIYIWEQHNHHNWMRVTKMKGDQWAFRGDVTTIEGEVTSPREELTGGVVTQPSDEMTGGVVTQLGEEVTGNRGRGHSAEWRSDWGRGHSTRGWSDWGRHCPGAS